MKDSKKFSLVNIIYGVVAEFVFLHLMLACKFSALMDPVWGFLEKVTGKDKESERINMFVWGIFWPFFISVYIAEKITGLKDKVTKNIKKKQKKDK